MASAMGCKTSPPAAVLQVWLLYQTLELHHLDFEALSHLVLLLRVWHYLDLLPAKLQKFLSILSAFEIVLLHETRSKILLLLKHKRFPQVILDRLLQIPRAYPTFTMAGSRTSNFWDASSNFSFTMMSFGLPLSSDFALEMASAMASIS